MSLNFNVSPYFDDFDPSKNFHRILFKPGVAVQGRELTQSQTILQDQISKFANNIFTQNTPITGGKVTTNLNVYYIKLNSTYGTSTIVAANFLNKIVTDSTGTVNAKVLATAEATGGDPPTLIVSYQSGTQFKDNDLIIDVVSQLTAQAISVNSTGLSSVASITEGVFYIVNGWSVSQTQNPDGTYSKYSIGNFVSKSPETIILSKYSNSPSVRVGLTITETIYDYIDDPSLLDPAIGASNYQAPGADRYVVDLSLSTQPLTAGSDQNFIELLRIQNGQIVRQVDGTVYSVIDDYFAKRDYETNGDYVVNDFNITPSANVANTQSYDLTVGKGLAYVRGYRLENQSDLKLIGRRARDTSSLNNNSVYFDYGNYFYVDTSNGVFDITTQPSIDLHCVPYGSIVTTNTKTYNSTLVGTARIRGLDYDHNTTDANTQSYVYKADVYNIVTNTLSVNTASATSNTLTANDSLGVLSSVANAYYGITLSIVAGTDSGEFRKVVSYNASSKSFTVDTPFTITPDATSVVNLILGTTAVESLVTSNTTSFPATIPSAFNINNTGKLNGIATGDTVLEDATAPELVYSIGYPYVATVSGGTYETSQVYRSQTIDATGTMTLTANTNLNFLGSGTLSSSVVKQNFTVILTSGTDANNGTTGSIMDFSTTGNTVTLSADKKTATFTSTLYKNATVTVIAKQQVTNADDTTLVLKSKNLYVGNTNTVSISGPSGIISSANGNTFIDLTNCQVYIENKVLGTNTTYSLYTTDVKRIRKIIDTGNPSVAATVGMLTSSQYDVTSQYVLDNGQRDGFYDHASIKLIAGASKARGNLLVIFDYYKHSGGDGYFSVASYLSPVSSQPENYAEIPTYISKHGTKYSLRDSLDFRPTRQNATSSFVYEYSSGTNPNIRIPVNLTQYTSSYSFYLARSDKLVLSKDKSFQLIEGVSGTNPSLPVEPDGSLVLAELYYDPYTAYVPGEAPNGASASLSIQKVQHRRWTMSDITDLQTRINNLEYYSSLSLLEQNAQSLQVPDVNGLNRFKNGILVDDFSTYGTADTSNPDFLMKIDTLKKKATPIEVVFNLQLQNPTVVNSAGTVKSNTNFTILSPHGTGTNLFTLPYTSANLVVQQLASNTVSVNPFSVSLQQGTTTITPPMDNWVDNNQNPSLLITDPNLQFYQQNYGTNVTIAGDWKTLPGTTYSVTSSQNVINHGRFNGPFGSQVGYTQTTTDTYSSQIQNVTTSSGYNSVGSSLSVNNNFVNNISVLPYIRPQQLIIKSKGLLINTPIKTWFDGINVDQYMKSPDIIRLTNVTGTFSENDVIGFYSSNKFYPTARVVHVQIIGSETRLYVAEVPGAPMYTNSTTMQNGFFDENGNYTGTTASGTLASGTSIFHSSGVITGVGGQFTITGNTTPYQLYKVQYQDWCSFLNQFGVWGDSTFSASFNPGNFQVSFPTTDTYTFTYAVDNNATIYLDGVVIATLSGSSTSNFTSAHTYSQTVTAGTHTITWSATNTGGPAGFALVVKDSNGNEVFASTNPPGVNYTGIDQEISLPDGGAYFTGVTKLKLDLKATNNSSIYVGSKINITTKYVIASQLQTSTYVPPSPVIPTTPAYGSPFYQSHSGAPYAIFMNPEFLAK